jgi:hypothetical protein
MFINNEPWPWSPAETGLVMTGWSMTRTWSGDITVTVEFTPLCWIETICRWLDVPVEL